MIDKKQEKVLSLYKPVHDRFERFCRARACSQMDFRDLMNDSLVVAFQKFDNIKSEKAFLSFLIGISIRLIANYSRKKREVLNDSEEFMKTIPSESRTDTRAEIYMLYTQLYHLPT